MVRKYRKTGYGRRRRVYRRRRFTRRARRFNMRVRRTVRRMAETKWRNRTTLDVLSFATSEYSNFAIGHDWTSAIPLGPGKDQRIGWRIRSKRYTLKMFIDCAANTTTGSNDALVRVIIYHLIGQGTTGGIVTPNDVLDTAATTYTNTDTMMAMANTSNVRIVRDYYKRMLVNYQAGTGTQSSAFINFSIPWVKNLTFDPDLGLRESQNVLFCMVLIGTNKSTTGADVQYRCFSRISYIDI